MGNLNADRNLMIGDLALIERVLLNKQPKSYLEMAALSAMLSRVRETLDSYAGRTVISKDPLVEVVQKYAELTEKYANYVAVER